MRGARQEHHVGDQVVVVGRYRAALPVSEGEGVRSPREHLLVAACDDRGF